MPAINLKTIKTLAGLTLDELAVELDKELPADAYQPVPGGANLTDIDPGHMKRVLNRVFGMCGIGWGYSYSSADLTVEPGMKKSNKGDYPAIFATLSHLQFWYKVVSDDAIVICPVEASGGSDNSVASYAMKGAITNAIGNAASQIGFQESVYLGMRSHITVRGGEASSTAKPASTKPAKATVSAQKMCTIHSVVMDEHPSNKGGTFFGHKVDGKWCYGKK
jgi:hypothetical protein